MSIVAHDGKLVAAEARDRVAYTQDAFDALRNDGEQLVSGRETEAVIDNLEMVEIQQDESDSPICRAATTMRERFANLFEQHHPVRKFGQWIVASPVLEQRLDTLVFRDVVHNSEQATFVAPILRHLHDLDGERAPAVVERDIERHGLTFSARAENAVM